MIDKNARIYLAGHTGLVGSAVLEKLNNLGYSNIFISKSTEVDLRDKKSTEYMFSESSPEYVINAAAKVGGIYANDSKSGEFIYDNIAIQTNLIEASRKFGVKKFIFLGSVCIYPKFAQTPVKEDYLLTGPLEPTNEAYAIAKISGIFLLRAYFKQFGLKSVSLMPCNIYGPNDNFDADYGHVIPAIFKKILISDDNEIELWGDGTPMREFLHSNDLASAILFFLNEKIDFGIYNIGSGVNISIQDLALKIAKITGFSGNFVWNKVRPNGTLNRILDSSRANLLGWTPQIDLEAGLKQTWAWFISGRG